MSDNTDKLVIECNNDVEKIKSGLCLELKHFSSLWKYFKKSVNDEYNMTYCEDSEYSYDKEDSNLYKIKPCKSRQNSAFCCYKALIKYSLFPNTHPTLMLTY